MFVARQTARVSGVAWQRELPAAPERPLEVIPLLRRSSRELLALWQLPRCRQRAMPELGEERVAGVDRRVSRGCGRLPPAVARVHSTAAQAMPARVMAASSRPILGFEARWTAAGRRGSRSTAPGLTPP